MPGHQSSSRAIRAGCAVGRPPVRLETRHLDREHVEHDDRRIDKIPQVVNEKADALIAARRRFMLLQRDAVLTLARVHRNGRLNCVVVERRPNGLVPRPLERMQL